MSTSSATNLYPTVPPKKPSLVYHGNESTSPKLNTPSSLTVSDPTVLGSLGFRIAESFLPGKQPRIVCAKGLVPRKSLQQPQSSGAKVVAKQKALLIAKRGLL